MTVYEMDNREYTLLFPKGARTSSLFQSAQIGSRSHVASCSVGTGFYSRGPKKPLTPSRAKVKNDWKFKATSSYDFIDFKVVDLPFKLPLIKFVHKSNSRRSQWPRGLRRGSTAARLLRCWVRIHPEAWMSVCCKCVLSAKGLCDELITLIE
jgi:hypothetical protein